MAKPTTIKLRPLDCAAVWREKEARYELSLPKDADADVPGGALALFAVVTRLINDEGFVEEQVRWFKQQAEKH